LDLTPKDSNETGPGFNLSDSVRHHDRYDDNSDFRNVQAGQSFGLLLRFEKRSFLGCQCFRFRMMAAACPLMKFRAAPIRMTEKQTPNR
jgi:hypothetical protein